MVYLSVIRMNIIDESLVAARTFIETKIMYID